MQKILVTGACGFIGSHLCCELLDFGYTVVGLDNLDSYYNPQIKKENLARIQEWAKKKIKDGVFSFVELDLNNQKELNQLLAKEKPTAVFHLAARPGVRASVKDPQSYIHNNINASFSLFEAMRHNNISRLVLGSTSSIYGKNEKVPFEESDSVHQVCSFYAATKRSVELMSQTYARLYQMQVLVVRYFTVYGPAMRPDLAIHQFSGKILAGEPITLFERGEVARDFTYVGDIVAGSRQALAFLLEQKSNFYEIFNLGYGKPIKVTKLVSLLEEKLNKKAIIKTLALPKEDVPLTFADTQKAQKKFGYQPKVALEDGLDEFMKWYRQSC